MLFTNKWSSLVLAGVHMSLPAAQFPSLIYALFRFIRHKFPEASSGPGKTKLSWFKHLLVVYIAENKPITWRAVVNSFAAFLDLTYIYMISTVCLCSYYFLPPPILLTCLSNSHLKFFNAINNLMAPTRF